MKTLTMGWRPILIIAVLMLVPLSVHARAAQTVPFASLGDLETALSAIIDDAAEFAVWKRVEASGGMPLIFGNTAVFLYRGKASTVEWRGDFSSWGPTWDAHGERMGESNIWRKSLQLLPGSRLDYKIVVDGEKWLFDPLNPHRQAGGSGANSEVRMPDWQPSELALRRSGIERGTLVENQVIQSKHMGYAITYRVYVPAGVYENSNRLPSIYVTDGPDYYRDDWGAMVTVMDNLIADGTMTPVIAVFVDQWDLEATTNRRGDELVPLENRTCGFCKFIVSELVPSIDNKYPTSKAARDRAILGTSLGGLFTTYMGLQYADTFGRIAIQSPAYQYPPGHHVLEKLLAAKSFPERVFLNVGLYERDFVDRTRAVAGKLNELGVDVRYLEVPDGHSWGQWRTVIDDVLLFFYAVEPEVAAKPEVPVD